MIADALVSASIGGSLTIFGGLRFAVDNGTATCSAVTVGSELAAARGCRAQRRGFTRGPPAGDANVPTHVGESERRGCGCGGVG